MKKTFIVITAVLLVLLVTACNTTGTETKNETDTVSRFANDVSSAEILSKFSKAEEAYGWFTQFSNIVLEDETVEVNGDSYGRVKNSSFSSTNDLRQYLLELFDENIVNMLFEKQTENANPYFIDTDYDLYAYTDIFGMYQYELNDTNYIVKQQSETEVLLTAVIKYTTPNGTHTCNQEYNLKYINDNWVFTDFKLPYEVILENIE